MSRSYELLGHGHGGHHGGGWGGGWNFPAGYVYEPAVLLVEDDPRVLVQEVNGEIFGAIDIGALQREMNKLKQVPVLIALTLLHAGQKAINAARTIADQRRLPGGGPRDEVYWKLQWHQDALVKLADSPNAIYGASDDLKQWTTRAFIEWNAVEEGSAVLDQALSQLWVDVKANIAALPQDVADKIESATSWAVWITVGIVTAVGLLLWKILDSGSVQQIAVRRLGGRA